MFKNMGISKAGGNRERTWRLILFSEVEEGIADIILTTSVQ
jgi:hypothetical protein